MAADGHLSGFIRIKKVNLWLKTVFKRNMDSQSGRCHRAPPAPQLLSRSPGTRAIPPAIYRSFLTRPCLLSPFPSSSGYAW